MEEHLRLSDRLSQWVTRHAEGPYILPWLALLAFLDGCISPFPAEIFLAALMVAHPKRWREYLLVTALAAAAGASVGYLIGGLLFQFLGQPLIDTYHFQKAFLTAQHLLHGHIFLTMAIAPFILPLPEKVFIYAAGFLGAHFIPFITGYFLGHTIRLAVFMYLAGRYGQQVIRLLEEYILIIAGVVLMMALLYGIVHWHLLPL